MRDDDEELLMDSDVEESVGSSHIREAQQTGANLAGSEPLLGQGMADDSLDESMFGVHVAPAVDLKPRVDEEVGRPNVERELEVEARAMSNKASPPPSSSSSTMPQSPDTDVAAIIQDDEGKDDPPKRSKLFLYIAIFALMIVVVAIPLAVVFAQRNNVSASEKEASALRKTAAPATFGPTMFPTTPPTADPTLSPSMPPSSIPSATPTTHTMYPTTTPYPSPAPSSVPTDLPSATPSASQVPSATPSDTPSATPTLSIAPSSTPTATPTAKPSASPSSTPSASPTITAAPTRSSVMRPILAAITPMSILEDPSTPQFRASGWLDDWPPNNYENNTASLFQRYAVATLDFALNPNADTITFGDPLQHVCEWKGVNCTGTNQTQVVGIVWANSSLSGSIPKEIGLLTRLEKLDFGENDIGSSLPSELFELTKLEYLYLHSNRFSGTLSQDFGKLANLVNFYGGDNQFTGSLPRGLGSPGTGAANTRPLRTYLSSTPSVRSMRYHSRRMVVSDRLFESL